MSVLTTVAVALLIVGPAPRIDVEREQRMLRRWAAPPAQRIEPAKVTPEPAPAPAPVVPSVDVAAWQPTVDCECSGSWDCPQGTTYLYGLQFHPDTWASHGGLEYGPNPTPEQQVVVALRVLASHASDPWPNCPNPGD